MLNILETVIQVLRGAIPNSYYQNNPSKPVRYPYLTFTYTTDTLENGRGVFIDFNLFDDQGHNSERIENQVGKLIDLVDGGNAVFYENDVTLKLDTITVNEFPTASEKLQRRTGQIYARTYDRREK